MKDTYSGLEKFYPPNPGETHYDPDKHFLTQEELEELKKETSVTRVDRSFTLTLESVYRFVWEEGYPHYERNIDYEIEYNIMLWYSQLSKEQKIEVVNQLSKDDHKLGKVFSGLDEVIKSPISGNPKISEYWDLYYPLYTQLKKDSLEMVNSLLERFGCEERISY